MMKKLIKNIVILLALTLVVLVAMTVFDYCVVGSQYEYNYQASLIDKVNRLESIHEPKIILVGDSNLAFGMNSKMVEDALGMPVVNLGLHGGLGNAYHEEIAKLNIGSGDIVVVCHSTFSDDDKINTPLLAWVTYDWHESLRPIVREKDYPAMLRAYPSYLRNSLLLWMTHTGNQSKTNSYSRNAFNAYGDIAYKPAEFQMDVDAFFKVTRITVPDINDTCTDRLNQLNEYCRMRGATLVIAGYPIAYGEYSTFDTSDFSDFKAVLQSKLDCPIISDYADYFFPYSYFYDTRYHLTAEGADARAQQLIEDLEAWEKAALPDVSK